MSDNSRHHYVKSSIQLPTDKSHQLELADSVCNAIGMVGHLQLLWIPNYFHTAHKQPPCPLGSSRWAGISAATLWDSTAAQMAMSPRTEDRNQMKERQTHGAENMIQRSVISSFQAIIHTTDVLGLLPSRS